MPWLRDAVESTRFDDKDVRHVTAQAMLQDRTCQFDKAARSLCSQPYRRVDRRRFSKPKEGRCDRSTEIPSAKLHTDAPENRKEGGRVLWRLIVYIDDESVQL